MNTKAEEMFDIQPLTLVERIRAGHAKQSPIEKLIMTVIDLGDDEHCDDIEINGGNNHVLEEFSVAGWREAPRKVRIAVHYRESPSVDFVQASYDFADGDVENCWLRDLPGTPRDAPNGLGMLEAILSFPTETLDQRLNKLSQVVAK
ncbi:hypothetical protein REH81_03680 [Vibrio rotiferianus]